MTQPLAPLIADAHLVLPRSDGRILLLIRANTGYMDGWASLPAGHVDPGEPADTTAVREAKEEIGVVIDRDDLAFAHVMHRRTPGENAYRISFFFTAARWTGEIVNAEPHKCDGLIWADPADLSGSTGGVPIVGYIADALAAISRGEAFSTNGW